MRRAALPVPATQCYFVSPQAVTTAIVEAVSESRAKRVDFTDSSVERNKKKMVLCPFCSGSSFYPALNYLLHDYSEIKLYVRLNRFSIVFEYEAGSVDR